MQARLSVFLFLLIMTPVMGRADARKPDSLAAGTARLSSERYHGNTISVGYETSPSDVTRVGVGASRLERTYAGNVAVIDSNFSLTSAYVFDGGRYIEGWIEVSPDAEILPKSIFGFVPHIVAGSTDFSLAIDYRTYQATTAASLHPSVRHEFSDMFSVAAGTFVARSTETLVAHHADVKFATETNGIFRATIAGGRTLEDAGVSAAFSSAYFGYTSGFGRFTAGFDFGRHWSDIRSETSVGIRIEFR